MRKGEIIRVWGKADSYDLVFSKGVDDSWNTAVPPDLTDGQYATEIHALDENGWVAIWSGILYMNGGKICLHMKENKYTFKFRLHTNIEPKYNNSAARYRFELKGVCCL